MMDMFGSLKRHKSYNSDEYGDRTDRISSLPDKILIHILSFLPTKYAVGTSILSHRWQHLFHHITNFDFDESLMFKPRSYAENSRLVDTRLFLRREGTRDLNLKLASSFKDFVDRVFMLCKSPQISKFRFKSGLGFDTSNLNTWIRVALHRGVTDLDISTYDSDPSVLPLSLFTSETLVVLKLSGRFEMKFPTTFQFPNLKFLHLFSVKFSDDRCSLNRFIAGCPKLDSLVLGGFWKDVKVINISSPCLRSLVMDFSDGYSSLYHRSKVVLDLPSLVYFDLADYLATKYCLNNLNSLEEARIDIILHYEGVSNYSDVFCDAILSLMHGVSNVKHLYLSGKCLEDLTFDQKKRLPTFPNLSRLELGCSRYVPWRFLLRELLQCSPVLEHLVFPEGLFDRERDANYDFDKNFWSKLRAAPPPCLTSHLKTILIDSFHGFYEELAIARYFLKHGKVLEYVILDWPIEEHEEGELVKLVKIRASQECFILLRDDFDGDSDGDSELSYD